MKFHSCRNTGCCPFELFYHSLIRLWFCSDLNYSFHWFCLTENRQKYYNQSALLNFQTNEKRWGKAILVSSRSHSLLRQTCSRPLNQFINYSKEFHSSHVSCLEITSTFLITAPSYCSHSLYRSSAFFQGIKCNSKDFLLAKKEQFLRK